MHQTHEGLHEGARDTFTQEHKEPWKRQRLASVPVSCRASSAAADVEVAADCRRYIMVTAAPPSAAVNGGSPFTPFALSSAQLSSPHRTAAWRTAPLPRTHKSSSHGLSSPIIHARSEILFKSYGCELGTSRRRIHLVSRAASHTPGTNPVQESQVCVSCLCTLCRVGSEWHRAIHRAIHLQLPG